MRLHKNLVIAVIKVLHGVFNQNLYAAKTIEKILKLDKRWGSRDRGFIAETSYEIVRWKRLYTEIAEVKAPYEQKKTMESVCCLGYFKRYSSTNMG